MNLDEHYCTDGPKVVYEIFDDEVVVINLDKGHYYSLTKAGAAMWKLVIEGVSSREMVELLAGRYDATPADIEAGVRQLLVDLVGEELLTPVAAPDAGAKAPGDIAEGPSGMKLQFEGLGVQKFTDMEEMLLLDPIHEVDETGWPNVKRA